jgi:hypothetical protein
MGGGNPGSEYKVGQKYVECLYLSFVVVILYYSDHGARFSTPVQTGPEAHPASCTTVTRSFLGVKSGRGVTLTPHPLLVPWS